MNMTLAPSERRTDSLAVKQALRSETVVGSRKRERKKEGMKTLLAASATGIHQCLSRQLPWVGNELVSSVCVLKQARGTLILPNQGLCWHIPSVVSLLSFYPRPKTEKTEPEKTGKPCLVNFVVDHSLVLLAAHATQAHRCEVCSISTLCCGGLIPIGQGRQWCFDWML